MPVSGFPNQTASVSFEVGPPNNLTSHFSPFSYRATQEDDMGILYLNNIDFLKCGVPASIMSALVRVFFGGILSNSSNDHESKVVASIGYILMLLVK